MPADKVADLLAFLERLCDRLDSLALELVTSPPIADETTKTVMLWRILLLAISSDVGRSVIRLGQLRDENHARAMRMLDRSLFEYGLRLEYYIFRPDEALKHGKNLSAWWGVLLKASQPYMKMESLTKEERRRLSDAINNIEGLEIPAIHYMLRCCLTMNGFKGGERKRRMNWLLSNYYHIGSSLIHGSQGAFLDFFGKNPASGEIAYTHKSARYSVGDTLFNSGIHLIGTISSEEKHRKKYLGVDMYYREFELTTGRWGILRDTQPRGPG